MAKEKDLSKVNLIGILEMVEDAERQDNDVLFTDALNELWNRIPFSTIEEMMKEDKAELKQYVDEKFAKLEEIMGEAWDKKLGHIRGVVQRHVHMDGKTLIEL